MQYTYQDSTKLPVQRDFIEDLQYFIEVSKEVIPLENSAIEMKEKEEAEIMLVEDRLNKIKKFENDIIRAVDGIERDEDIKELLEIKKATIDTCTSTSQRAKEKLQRDLEQLNTIADRNIGQFESKMLSMLNKLFDKGVYGAHKSYSASVDGGRLTGVLKASLAEMEYRSNLTFDNELLTIRDVNRSFSLPIWSRAGLIHREDKVKMIDVLDFVITSINYDGDQHFETSFEDKKAEKSFRIVRDTGSYKIYHAEQEITADDTLVKNIKMGDLEKLVENLKNYLSTHVRSQTLTQVMIDGKNAIKTNEVFDCLKIIAEQYGEIVRECRDRGYVKDEITIKIEEEDGTRTEKYVERAEIFQQLSELGSEGIELAGILGIEK